MSSGTASPRGTRMEERVVRAAEEARVPASAIGAMVRALRGAMATRESGPSALSSDQDPDFLHPGRTLLILIGDLEERSAEGLAVGALAESRRPELRVTDRTAADLLDPEAAELWRTLPSMDWAGGEDFEAGPMLEALLLADPVLQRVAFAEALDHLRHAHLWTDRGARRGAATLALEVFAPLAPRVHPVLVRRLEWWIRRVGRKLLEGPS